MLSAVWAFWRWLQVPGPASAVACGAISGLALLSKYTALLLLPIDVMVAAVWWIQSSPMLKLPARLREMAGMAVIACLLINFSYGLGFHLDEYVLGIGQIYPDLAPNYVY